MKALLQSTQNELEYIGTNAKGKKITLSGTEGVSPMESVLIAGASCTAIDIELILKKMRQDLQQIEVEIEGQRDNTAVPKVFTKIHLHYKLFGIIKLEKAEFAVSKSVEKYCSVLTMLVNVDITHSFEIINSHIKKS